MSKHVETRFNIILNAIALQFFLIFIKCRHKGRVQTGKFVSRNRDLGCATFSERARRRAKFKNIASGAQILKVRAQKMKIV